MTLDEVSIIMGKAAMLGGHKTVSGITGQIRIKFCGKEIYAVKKKHGDSDYWCHIGGTLYNKPKKAEKCLIRLMTVYRRLWEEEHA